MFCENCGYDFLSGALPPAIDEPAPEPASQAPTTDPPTEAPAPDPGPAQTGTVRIDVDLDYFALMAPDGGVDAPPDGFAAVEAPLKGDEVLIGRTSMSRGVFPDLDLLAVTSDPAVSTRHATLRRDADGNWTITDLNSTNGTHVGTTDTAIAPGQAVALAPGTTVYLGAYTTLTLHEPETAETADSADDAAVDDDVASEPSDQGD